ncbi:MAG: A/G-specific adenine glycosylase [Bacilli bacterium]|nr:A/G-specific adenine glycosylase [Bacilli bacterium]
MKNCVEIILNWYRENKRDLPWRKDIDPYHVWISEIMLQQTRIDAVIDYYEKFMNRLPSIKDLSEISEDELLKLWEGLGYYSRARNLKKAAVLIMEKYHGVFPNTYDEILSLPGIGEYTAGAIASICFQLKEVAVDGNVMRVYSRVQDLDIDVSDLKVKKKVGEEIKKILPEESGEFNQGIMELGEVICLPNGEPKCELCPLKSRCMAFLNKRQTLIPRKIKKMEKLEEEYTLFLMKYNNKYALRKRDGGLLKNMWEFPNKEGFYTYDEVKEIIPNIKTIQLGITNTHIFTHKKWFMNSYYLEVSKMDLNYSWFTIEEIENNLALPSAFTPFLEYIKKCQN